MTEENKRLTPIKAIKANCLECSGGSFNEVKLCTCVDCPLFPYRLGKNPYIKPKNYTDEQRQAMSDRLKKVRENK